MKITIVGAGRVGMHLAKYFADEQQDVYLVDRNPENLSLLESDFNLRTFVGEPTDFNVLREANTENADVFVTVTSSTAENLVACAMAKSMGAKKTIARVDRYNYLLPSNHAVLNRMGVDQVVLPDYLAAQSIIGSLEHPWCRGWSEFDNGAIIMVAVDVTDSSPIAGHYIRDLFSESHSLHISALKRDNRTIIPRGDDLILAGDVLYITALPEGIEKVMNLAGVTSRPVKNVIIMGGSMVSELAVGFSGKKFEYTIIDKKRERCTELTHRLTDCEIIFGDASEFDVLDEAGINNCDAFIALTDNTESNILSCLTAVDLGVRRTIAEVEKEQLIAKAEAFNVGTVINKPIITANAIFQLILDSDAASSRCLVLTDADVARLQIKDGSFLTRDCIKDMKIPRELTFAGMIRNGKGMMVTGLTKFQPGDTVIVFCLSGALKKVEKLFNK